MNTIAAAAIIVATAIARAACAADTSATTVTFSVVADGIPEPIATLPGDAIRGRALLVARDAANCVLCHAIPDPDVRFAGDLGPSLAGIGARLSIPQLRLRVADNLRRNPATIMPSYFRTAGQERRRCTLPRQADPHGFGSRGRGRLSRHAAMTGSDAARLVTRRQLLQAGGALVLVPWLPAHAGRDELPDIPALSSFLAGRSPKHERVQLSLPQLADNGQAVPMKVVVDGPFTPDSPVRTIHLFSEANPVPEMAVFEFPVPVERVEVESRVRLATTQRVVAVATMGDGALFAAAAEVIVTLTGCLDGT